MIPKHPSESEIQQYALGRSECDGEILRHIESCEACKTGAQNYMQMFGAIREQPKAIFDFDLAALVMQQLPKTKSRFSLNLLFPYLFASLGLLTLVVFFYRFRKNIFNVLTGNFPITMYLILIIPLSILIFQSIDMYKKHQKQMSILN
jgi:hypothetical protein